MVLGLVQYQASWIRRTELCGHFSD